MAILKVLVAAALALIWAGSAQAGLRVCNETADVQSISVGYQGDEGWTSEGWWNADPGACIVTLPADLTERYYYYRAEVKGGDFAGENYFFCTQPTVYTIVGDAECVERGFDREAFREVDVGAGSTEFTVTLAADSAAAAPAEDLGLRICNDSDAEQAVSIAYEGDEGWTSEGWWNVQPAACATVVAGALQKRYYYLRSEVDGKVFTEGAYGFCTTPKEYTIVGDKDCPARGYDAENFAEIDTGSSAKGYTYRIAGEVVEPTPTPVAAEGLRICNETANVQAISIAYEGDEDWTSEGWWNLEKGSCATVVAGELQKRYYYYRAEVDGGPFPGQGYGFCTSPQVYTIVGDKDCEDRGYEREDFAEIDTGATAKSFVFTLVSDEALAAPEPAVEAMPEPIPEPEAVPEAVMVPEPEVMPEPEPEPEVMPEPEPEPEIVPEPEAPAPSRRGGSRGG